MRMTVVLHARMRHSHRALDDDVDVPLTFSPLTPGGVTGAERSPIFWQMMLSNDSYSICFE